LGFQCIAYAHEKKKVWRKNATRNDIRGIDTQFHDCVVEKVYTEILKTKINIK